MKVEINMPKDVKKILNRLKENGYEAYIVGGCVRDSILKRNPNDWDITTNAKPEEVMNLFDKVILTGIKHGTVTIVINKQSYEVTTYRTDGEYEDNRRPKEVKFVRELKEDLARRDFTINAMAYNEEEGLVDYFDGINDLNNKIIRTVGDPKKRFSEDALRMLRAIRFSSQLDFIIDKNILLAIKELKNNINNISKERIREEFNKILISNPRKINILKECELIDSIVPFIGKIYDFHKEDLYNHIIISTESIEPILHLRLIMLLNKIGKVKEEFKCENSISKNAKNDESTLIAEKILKELKYDNDTINKVLTLIFYYDYNLTSKLSIKRILNKIGEELTRDLIKIQRADILAQNSVNKKAKLENLDHIECDIDIIIGNGECFDLKNLNIDGKDLINVGFNKGIEIGDTLKYLLDLVIEEPELNIKEKLIKKAKEKLNN